ncbi:ATP-binding cassette domain-containing protein [Pontibacter qinzhouensis]|uniref:ATP-binding cassette domain-containing protein n=1 Tax=Pontibacter qinzhouensis TaxID=2603253 RepID=A0A5C8K2Y7_9BACT|nr:ATP-binding cassette domain-containing protein [Pontibacter qinzhouensis]TXK44269.1 ATP-binding cassette domain-containing protein [Pontibacter qinzhouensis]
MIELRNLNVTYEQRPVLLGCNLQLAPGQVHGLVGLNGAGKTTLLNTLVGVVKPRQGEVLYNGLKLRHRQVGYLEASNYFYANITGQEYLGLFPNNSPTFNTDTWQQLLHLPLHQLIETYSTGMKKKLALLAVLKLDRDIVILDEPFNGLDMEASQLLKSIVLKLRERQKTIIITSHIFESLTSICDQIHYLDNGCIAETIEQSGFRHFEDRLFETIRKQQEELMQKVL